MGKKIKILVSCHTNCFVPQNNIIQAIQVGAKNATHIDGMLYDDSGDNISDKNSRYCELTAQYWAWKNLDADYYGFFHHRRYFSFSDTVYKTDTFQNVSCEGFDENFSEMFGLDEQKINDFIGDNDIIVPEPMSFLKNPTLKNEYTVYSHYEQSPGHHIEDFEFVLRYIEKNCPEYYPAAMKYAKSNYGYFLNMYVMKKDIFKKYCEWLYPILDAFDKQHDYTYSSLYEYRTPGLLAERLFGLYLTYLLDNQKDLKVKYAQTVFIEDTQNPYPTPFKETNNIPVCLASSDEYSLFAGNVIQSIICNSSADNNYDIFVISNGIKELNKELLLKLIVGKDNFSLRFINGKKYLRNRTLCEQKHITVSSYLRLGILDFLRNYKKAVYLDCDLVVNTDIAEFYNYDITNNYFGAVIDSVENGWLNLPETGLKKYNVESLKLESGYEYFNAGVVLFNIEQLRKEYSSQDLFTLAESRKWRWQDQDILNFIGKDKTVFLPQDWNVMVHEHKTFREMPEYTAPKSVFEGYKQARNHPKIVHYCGRSLPCFCPTADLSEYFWKYAMKTPFFDAFFVKMAQEQAHESICYLENLKANRKKQRKIRCKNRLIHFIASIFPRNSKIGIALRKIYNKNKH